MKVLIDKGIAINDAVKNIEVPTIKKEIDIETLLQFKIKEIENLKNKIIKKTSD